MGEERSRRFTSQPLIVIVLAVLALELVFQAAPHAADLFKRPPPRVPAKVAVVWAVQRASHTLLAFDWSGHRLGTLDQLASSASPDGQRLWAQGAFIDAQGDVLARPALPSGDIFTWAAGSDGVCGYDAGLWTYRLAGGKLRRVAALPNQDGRVAGCSFARDLALVTTGSPGQPATLWWIRLHDGAVLAQKRYSAYELGDVEVSPDFRFFAENYYRPLGIDIYGLPGATIRQVDGGAAVATRSDLVTAFSADGADVATVVFGGGVVGVFTVGGAGIWSSGGYRVPDLYAAPTGSDFVGERLDSASRTLRLLLVHGDGTTTTVAAPAFDSLLASA